MNTTNQTASQTAGFTLRLFNSFFFKLLLSNSLFLRRAVMMMIMIRRRRRIMIKYHKIKQDVLFPSIFQQAALTVDVWAAFYLFSSNILCSFMQTVNHRKGRKNSLSEWNLGTSESTWGRERRRERERERETRRGGGRKEREKERGARERDPTN